MYVLFVVNGLVHEIGFLFANSVATKMSSLFPVTKSVEYIRQKYVFNDPRFSKSKFNERERKEEKDCQEFKERSKHDVAAYYGHPTITCPTCGSTNTEKISALSKGVSVGLFGIFSQKVKHQFHCNSCGYEW